MSKKIRLFVKKALTQDNLSCIMSADRRKKNEFNKRNKRIQREKIT